MALLAALDGTTRDRLLVPMFEPPPALLESLVLAYYLAVLQRNAFADRDRPILPPAGTTPRDLMLWAWIRSGHPCRRTGGWPQGDPVPKKLAEDVAEHPWYNDSIRGELREIRNTVRGLGLGSRMDRRQFFSNHVHWMFRNTSILGVSTAFVSAFRNPKDALLQRIVAGSPIFLDPPMLPEGVAAHEINEEAPNIGVSIVADAPWVTASMVYDAVPTLRSFCSTPIPDVAETFRAYYDLLLDERPGDTALADAEAAWLAAVAYTTLSGETGTTSGKETPCCT